MNSLLRSSRWYYQRGKEKPRRLKTSPKRWNHDSCDTHAAVLRLAKTLPRRFWPTLALGFGSLEEWTASEWTPSTGSPSIPTSETIIRQPDHGSYPFHPSTPPSATFTPAMPTTSTSSSEPFVAEQAMPL